MRSCGVAADVKAAARYFALSPLNTITESHASLAALMKLVIVAYCAADAMTKKHMAAIFLRLLNPIEFESELRELRSRRASRVRAARRSKRKSTALLCAAEIDLAQGITD